MNIEEALKIWKHLSDQIYEKGSISLSPMNHAALVQSIKVVEGELQQRAEKAKAKPSAKVNDKPVSK